MPENNPWGVTNHGGNPTQNKKAKAVFIGRFQPYHFGHIELIEQKINKGIPVLILIRDVQPDEKNPLSASESAYLIRKYHAIKKQDVTVNVIPDIESVNYGRGVGYEVNEFVPRATIAEISATKIRESIKYKNDDWKNIVPIEIQDEISLLLNKEQR